MKVLLTGANGYIGKRLLPLLVQQGHSVVCCVRQVESYHVPEFLRDHVDVIEIDFLMEDMLDRIPDDIEGAYYLMHSMTGSSTAFSDLEERVALNFNMAVSSTKLSHVIYLTGIVNSEELSNHLASRKKVEEVLFQGDYHVTALRAGIIIGSGSASFEIIRDLVEKLPVMITPKWVMTKSQPIAIRDVLHFLVKSLGMPYTYDQHFDIYSPDILTYKEILLGYAEVRGLNRTIISVPVMTPKLSSYWLHFVTSVTYNLAASLIYSMKVDVIAEPNDLAKHLGITPISYQQALQFAFKKIEQNAVLSSWKDSAISGVAEINIDHYIKVPSNGVLSDKRTKAVADRQQTIEKIWSIGGSTGWYYADFLWKIRGFMDQMVGGVGLRRGRTNPHTIESGNAIDFWRVLYANKEQGRLLLFAEMKLPGDAWLEFKLENDQLVQTATFRPKGLLGRLYWYSVVPLHEIVFGGMIRKLAA